jgi:hypothetical protein
MKRWAVVVPTNRPERCREFICCWSEIFKKHQVCLYVIEDGPRVTFRHELADRHFSWKDIDIELGKMADIIPRKSASVRNFGFYKAYQEGMDYILTLDDDVVPGDGDLIEEFEKVFISGAPLSPYLNLFELLSEFQDSHLFPRGFPISDRKSREVLVQTGVWNGSLDLDGMTQLLCSDPESRWKFMKSVISVPIGAAVTLSSMNLAFKRQAVPMMYQLDMGGNGCYNRWGDIWAGLVAKRICDNLGYPVVVNTKASVQHSRLSDPFANLESEAPGYVINEKIWRGLLLTQQNFKTIEENYKHISYMIETVCANDTLAISMRKWLKLLRSVEEGK